jgi:L-ascorbate metabolism protein UlaG (beta-lactamase superfamily)
VVDHPSFRFFFAGDTGWSDDVHEITRRFAPFDLAAIPVGAYEPRWFMATQHINPHEAVRMYQALGKPLSLGIHWGTFQLTDEAYEDPMKDLIAAMKHEGIALDRFRLFVPGQTLRLVPRHHKGD